MRQLLTDLRVVVLLVVAGGVALLVPEVPWQVAWLLGLPLILFLPGYALVAALFIERPSSLNADKRAPGWPARFGLSLGVSMIVVATAGVALASEAPGKFTLPSMLTLVGGVTLLGVIVAAGRRARIPRDRRADALARLSIGGHSESLGTNRAQSLALVLALVVLAGAFVFAGTAPTSDPHSQAYLTGGEAVDVGPENATLVADSPNTMALALENHEGETTEYQVVTRLQEIGANGSVRATEQLDEFQVGLAANETRIVERSFVPSLSGEDLRLQVLVYTGETSGAVGPETADLSLRLWVTSTDSGAA